MARERAGAAAMFAGVLKEYRSVQWVRVTERGVMNRWSMLALGAAAVFGMGTPAGWAQRTNRYVVKDNVNAAPPYDSWANAAANIQTAIDYGYTAAGSTVLVAAAVYDTGGTVVPSRMLTNRVYLSKAITVRSADNDPATTIIKGAWDPVKTNGAAAVRCVYMVNDAVLIGFTLTNGATITTNERPASQIGPDASGGGVWAQSAAAVISNCVIGGNAASSDRWNTYSGGGAFQGTLFNCTLAGNFADMGGGAHLAILSNCTVAGNSAVLGDGGGTRACTLYGCVISNNNAATFNGEIGRASCRERV